MVACEATVEESGYLAVAGGKPQIELVLGDDARGLRDQEINLAACVQQAFQQAQAVSHAGGAGEGEGDAFHGVLS